MLNKYRFNMIVTDASDMGGVIPTEVAKLNDLKYLDLSSNNLTGVVPVELGLLPKLGKIIYLIQSSLQFQLTHI